jgi:hypothetical protein
MRSTQEAQRFTLTPARLGGRLRIGGKLRLGGRLRFLALPLAVVGLLACFAAPALGAKTHRLKTTFGESTFTGAISGVAVEETSDNVFVADRQLHRVVIFGPEGGPPVGVNPPEIIGLPAPTGVAVDNSATSPSKGAIYVSEENGAVKKFALVGEEYKPVGELIASPTLKKVFGLAVDSNGDVFVSDNEAKALVEFSPAGTEVARLDVSTSVGAPVGVAVDSFGDLFVQGGNASIYRFAANGGGEVEPGTVPELIVAAGHAFGLAVDLDTDALYVSGQVDVAEYGASCAAEGEGAGEHCSPEGAFGAGSVFNARGVAANSGTGSIYVIDEGSGGVGSKRQIAVFGPTVIVPGVTTGKATAITGESAALNGSVDPSGSLVDECKFEWGVTSAYGNVAPCEESPVDIGSGNGPVPVQAEIAGLAIGTEYHFRLVATSPTTVPNEEGPSVGADAQFTTLGPQIHCESLSGIGDTTARLEACIDPVGQETTYFFQYVSQVDFEAGEYAKATSVPLGGEAIGAGNADIDVSQQVAGLSPNTTYHFRVIAVNASGTAEGADRTLKTYLGRVSGLPDGRAYEQVSPVDKGGAAPSGDVSLIQAAKGGDGFLYSSRGGLPGSEGGQQLPTYLASRASDWSTQGVLPPESLGAVASMLGWSEDLSRTYVAQAVLPGDKLRFLERDSASRSLRTIAAEGGTNILTAFRLVGVSEDGSVVVFEAEDPTKLINVYAWNRATGTVSLAGALPGGAAPVKGALAGSNQVAFRNHILQDEHTVSSDGSHVYFTDAGTGQLYLRENPTAEAEECADPAAACTIQVSASQRTPTDPKGKKPATFWGATPKGDRAFFTSPGKLTNDATTGPNDEGNDLYRYDVESGKLIDIAPDPSDPDGADVQGVLGASEDGSYVYFAANGVLTNTSNSQGKSAAPGDCSPSQGGSGACNLYLWHEGATLFVARLTLNATSDSDARNWASTLESPRSARVASDGQTLLFSSEGNPTAYDSQGFPELYRYHTPDGDLNCVSCNPTGSIAPLEQATLQSVANRLRAGVAPVLSRNLSADGSRVFFETPDKLVAADTNGEEGCPFLSENPAGARACQDVYEWEAKGSGSCESEAQNGGCLYLLSSGQSSEPSFFGDADEKGDNAFLYTGQPLVGQDGDQIVDIYDARVGGGIASQNPPPPPSCAGPEGCRGAVPPPPAEPGPGTTNVSGSGNVKHHRHHKKKQHKKKHSKRRHSTRKQG